MTGGREQQGGQRGPIAWMAGHSVTANLLMLVLLIGGLIMGQTIRKDVFPDFELDLVTITVPYPGASPEEVERGAILAIEEVISDLEGIKTVTATAAEGMGTVTAEIIQGEDVARIAQEIKNAVDRISSFPDDVEDLTVTIPTRKRYVVSLALYGDQPETVLREMAETVRDRLLQNKDISHVELTGIRNYEISIEVPQHVLRTLGLTLNDIAQTVSRAAIEVPGGAIRTEAGDVLVRVTERRELGKEFGRIPVISSVDGSEIFLEDIAVIRDGFEETDHFATFNGLPAVMLEVYRVGRQTPVSVSEAVHRQVAEINTILPEGLSLVSRNDRSDIYNQRLNLMLKNGYLGLGLVFILLALFLETRLAFWVSLGIPISFLGSMLILPGIGATFNMISMFAFIVTLGIVVDDAIVVGENIYYFRQKGYSWREASVTGARNIATPVVFSVLTNMVTFLPILFVPGFMGKVFREIPLVVISVFCISLIESLFILPAHLGHTRTAERKKTGVFAVLTGWQQKFSRGFTRFTEIRYGPFLQFALRWRYVTFATGLAILLVSYGYIKSGRLGFELFPKIESDYASVTAVLPFGTSVSRTREVTARLIEAGRKVAGENGGEQLVEGVYAQIDGNKSVVLMYLTPPDVRPISTVRLTELWRQEVGELAGLETIRFESDAGGPGRGAAIAVEMSHRDIRVLEQAGSELAAALENYPGVYDVDDGFSLGKQQIDFKILPEAQSLNLHAADVARQVRQSYYGAEALRLQRGRNEVKVMVRLPREERVSEYHLEEMVLRTADGGEIPLLEAVAVERGRAHTSIDRRDGRRIITVYADVQPRSKADLIMASLNREIFPELQASLPGLNFSYEGRIADRRESVQSLLTGLLIALVIIYAMLSVPLNSYVQPLIIMLAIPFGLVGAVAGHLIMGYSLSVLSLFGIVALSGVVVNSSLVLIDFANRQRRRGRPAVDAVLNAAVQRFRPIMLTTLTTFGGLSPMIFETSRQARFLIPMAISLGYGVVFAAVITLVIVPSVYLIVEDVRRLFRTPDRVLG
ncbi:MAG TPA: efflux RND transporter permease subunit [Desulfobacteraceae bacterium]|nr:efflux RND transporter permease subunit [Desulfobacteraceae bacterium]